jgi:hypothetical protein
MSNKKFGCNRDKFLLGDVCLLTREQNTFHCAHEMGHPCQVPIIESCSGKEDRRTNDLIGYTQEETLGTVWSIEFLEEDSALVGTRRGGTHFRLHTLKL